MLKSLFSKNSRLISSIIIILLIIPFFLITYFVHEIGSYIGASFFCILAMLAMREVFASLKINKYTVIFMTLVVIPFFLLGFNDFKDLSVAYSAPISQRIIWALQDWKIYLIILVFSFVPLSDANYRENSKNLFINQLIVFIVMIISSIFAKMIWTMNIHDLWLMSFFLLIAIISDVFAFLGGKVFGQKWFRGAKLAPKISPKKTWAGWVIGNFFALLFAILAGYFTHIWKDFGSNELLTSILAGSALTLIAPMGDLLFSAIKRWTSIKDFSNLIPGHGGIFDRVDAMSLVFVLGGIIFLFK